MKIYILALSLAFCCAACSTAPPAKAAPAFKPMDVFSTSWGGGGVTYIGPGSAVETPPPEPHQPYTGRESALYNSEFKNAPDWNTLEKLKVSEMDLEIDQTPRCRQYATARECDLVWHVGTGHMQIGVGAVPDVPDERLIKAIQAEFAKKSTKRVVVEPYPASNLAKPPAF
jgi:hypothetical protein